MDNGGSVYRQPDEKYLLINQAFASKQRAKGDNRKDKAGEKLAVSEEDLLEHRTDGTDAFDTIYIGAKKIPYREAFSISTSGILLQNTINTQIMWYVFYKYLL